eukprot:m.83575 g.83575  ORF g.83575 m.83575 type:complete len:534 (-) comp12126_c0_seq1:143-1744(-)
MDSRGTLIPPSQEDDGGDHYDDEVGVIADHFVRKSWFEALKAKLNYDNNLWLRQILFWLIMFFYMFAIQLGGPAGNELVQKMVCERNKANNYTNSSQPSYCNSATVTGKASDLLIYYNLAMVIPSFFIVTTLGSLSDMYGRKIMMFLPCVGSLLQQLGILLVIYLDLSLPWLYMPMLAYGFFGTYALFLLSLFTSVADITTPHERTVWIGFMEGMNLVGTCAGYYTGGVITHMFGYKTIFWVVAGVYVFVMLLVSLIKEPLPKNKRKKHVSFMEANVVSSLAFLWKRVDRLILGTAFLFMMTTFVGYQIVILYLRHLFDWDEQWVGAFLGVTRAVQGFSVLVILRIIVHFFGNKAKDYPLAQISLIALIGQYLLWAFFREEHVMFAINAMGLLSGIAPAVCRSMVSKTASSENQGKVFGALGAVEVLTGLTGPIIFNKVFNATVHTRDNTFLFVGAGMTGVVSLLFWAYAAAKKRGLVVDEIAYTTADSHGLVTNYTTDEQQQYARINNNDSPPPYDDANNTGDATEKTQLLS